jgi:hypothetical protein
MIEAARIDRNLVPMTDRGGRIGPVRLTVLLIGRRLSVI